MIDSSKPSPYVRASFSFASPDQMDQASTLCSLHGHKEEIIGGILMSKHGVTGQDTVKARLDEN